MTVVEAINMVVDNYTCPIEGCDEYTVILSDELLEAYWTQNHITEPNSRMCITKLFSYQYNGLILRIYPNSSLIKDDNTILILPVLPIDPINIHIS